MKKTTIEELVYGGEPIFIETDIYPQSTLISSLNWYNYNATHEELKQYTIDYFNEVLPEVVSTLEEVPKTLIPKTLGTLCRMLSRGYPISNYILGKIDTLLKDLLASTYEKELLKPVVDKKPAKVIDKTTLYIGDIDDYLDYGIRTHAFPKKDWNKYSNSLVITKKEKLEVAEYYMSLLTQLKNCEDEYNSFSKPIFDKYVNTVQNIVDAFSIVTPRKIRTPKPVDLIVEICI